MIDNDSLLFRSVVDKAGRPSFEGLEAEGEAVLSWGETTTIKDHGLLSGEHVSGLVVFHFEVSVSRCTDVAGTVVVLVVLLGFTVRDGKILNG